MPNTSRSTTSSPARTHGRDRVIPGRATPVHAPPPIPLPPIPDAFVPVDAADLRGYRPMQSEMAAASEAVSELADVPEYDRVFGISAPPPDQLAEQLRVAADWTAALQELTAWTTYAKSQQGIAWKEALQLMERLKRPFELAAEADPALVVRFSALARLLGASRAAGKRAAATRARNKEAQAPGSGRA